MHANQAAQSTPQRRPIGCTRGVHAAGSNNMASDCLRVTASEFEFHRPYDERQPCRQLLLIILMHARVHYLELCPDPRARPHINNIQVLKPCLLKCRPQAGSRIRESWSCPSRASCSMGAAAPRIAAAALLALLVLLAPALPGAFNAVAPACRLPAAMPPM